MSLSAKETFFRKLRQELSEIPDLPLVENKKPGEDTDQQTQDDIVLKIVSDQKKLEAQQQNPDSKANAEETLNIKIKKDVENALFFEEHMKEHSEMLFGGVSGYEYRVNKKKYLTQKMFSIISKIKLQDSAVRFRGFVAIFFIQKKNIPLYDMKLLQSICIKEGFAVNSYKMNSYERTKKALFEKECLNAKENVSEEQFEALFTNQEIFDLDKIVGEDIIYQDEETLEDHFRQTKMSMSSTNALRSALTIVKTNTAKNKFLSQKPSGVENALVISFRTRRTDDYHKIFKKLIEEKNELMGGSFQLVHVSKNRAESFLDTQLFFPELFQVNFITLLSQPALFNEKLRAVSERKLEEVLNMNHYRIIRILEATPDNDRLARCLKPIFCNNIQLSNFLLHDSGRVKMTIAGKMGPNQINDFGIELENCYKIMNQTHNYDIYKNFFPEIYNFSKVVFLMRPLISGSFLDEITLNLFRVNGFTIIKRLYIKLSKEQAIYLAKQEKIEPSSETEYLSLMMDGETQIILMSNYAAIEKAKIITDGSNMEWIRGNQVLEFSNVDDEIEAGESQTNQVFRNIAQLISLGKLYDISSSYSISKESNERVKFQEKIKFLKSINLSSLNFFGFSSNDPDSTDELISLFMPDCSVISSIYIILKSSFRPFDKAVSDILARLGYKILEKKELIFNQDQAAKFIDIIETSPRGNEVIELRKEWNGQNILYNVAKIAGKKEMVSLLRNFFLSHEANVPSPLTKEHLYKILIPCWNPASENFINGEILKKTKVFDGDEFERLDELQKADVLNYILNTTVGCPMKDTFSWEKIESTDDDHIQIRVETQDYGEYHIRIRNLNRDAHFYLKGVKDEYTKIATYYERVNFVYSQKVPGFYQYRIVPMDNLSRPDHVYDCQEYLGDLFLKAVSREMLEHRSRELREAYKYNSSLFHKDKGSIVSFMYGAKLAVFCKKLEKILPTDIKGYGPIKITDEGKPVGLWSLEGRKLNECQRVKEILSRVTHYIEGRAYSVLEDINLTIDKIFDSDTYKFSRLEENYRIVPVFLTSNNLRIFSKIDNRDMQIVYDEFKTINYDFEKTLKDKENDKEKAKRNKDFGMVYAAPKIGGKYSIIANLFFIMNYELKIITRKTDLTKGDESEYNVLVSGLADGLAKHYNLDPDDEDFMDNLREECKEQGKPVPIDILEMEKFFCILEGINLKLDILSDIANLRNENLNALNQLNKEKYELMKTSSVSALDPLKLKQTQLEDFKEMYSRQEIKLKQDIKHLVSFLHKLNLTPSTEEKLALKGTKIKIEKERYFKPVVNEIVDDNLYREKYKKNLTNYRELDPKLLEMEFFKNAQNDEVSRHWLKPKDLYVYDAKEAESNKVDDLFVDPFLIPNEEREKELMRKQLSTQTYFKKINK